MFQGLRQYRKIVVSSFLLSTFLFASSGCLRVLGPGVGTSTKLEPVPAITSADLNFPASFLAVGHHSSCAVSDKKAFCWGLNDEYQIGDGTVINRENPTQVLNLGNSVLSLSVGKNHSCAILLNGSAYCWGNNEYGQLGDGSNTNRTLPTLVTGLTADVTQISVGDFHTCAVVSGGIQCWGRNNQGQLGDGTNTDSNIPIDVSGIPAASDATVVSAGALHSCGVVSGAAQCWGLNSTGQLGDSSTTTSNVPVGVTGLGTGVDLITAGGSHSCAVVSDAIQCWGDNTYGQLGDTTTTQRTAPVASSGLATGAQTISAGFRHTCATQSGNVLCWGWNHFGQTGEADLTVNLDTAAQVSGLTTNFLSVSTGYTHSCALENTGKVYCWGHTLHGQMGNGLAIRKTSPVSVSNLGSGVTSIDSSNTHSCASVNGAAKCWGLNDNSQLGDGLTADTAEPVAVVGMTSGVTNVSVGEGFSCALKDGGVKCWGINTNGQLGNGTTVASTVIVDATGLTAGVTHLSVSPYNSSCAIQNGAAFCWGLNTYGQGGDGTTTQRTVPTAVIGGLNSGVTKIASGDYHHCAVKNGAAYCWGRNANGQLGDTTLVDASTPVAVTGLGSGVTDIVAYGNTSCAIVNGAAECWGANSNYQLGDGTNTDSATSAEVTGLSSNVSMIALNQFGGCAVYNGLFECWGSNKHGGVGDGTTSVQTTPTSVLGWTGANVTFLARGWYNHCLIASGASWCWGALGNSLGNVLGQGTSSTVVVPGLVSDWP